MRLLLFIITLLYTKITYSYTGELFVVLPGNWNLASKKFYKESQEWLSVYIPNGTTLQTATESLTDIAVGHSEYSLQQRMMNEYFVATTTCPTLGVGKLHEYRSNGQEMWMLFMLCRDKHQQEAIFLKGVQEGSMQHVLKRVKKFPVTIPYFDILVTAKTWRPLFDQSYACVQSPIDTSMDIASCLQNLPNVEYKQSTVIYKKALK